MKVEFTVDECHQMFEAVIASLNDLDLTVEDKYALKNYRSKGFEIFKEEEIDFVA